MLELILYWEREINSIFIESLRAKECNSPLWMWEQCGRKKNPQLLIPVQDNKHIMILRPSMKFKHSSYHCDIQSLF